MGDSSATLPDLSTMLRPQPLPLPVLGARRRLVRGLRAAMATDELELHYQPKVQVAGGRATGVEALLRWREPRQGLLAPGAFLPAVEHHDVMEELGAYVLDTALRQASEWDRAGWPVPVSVNVSPASLLDPRLPETVLSALERWDVAPRDLVLEITETAVLQDLHGSAAILREVATHGVRISLDDFGTGHSSLARLVQLPIDELKIDRCFVRDMAENSAGAAVVGAIVALAQDLGHRVVAEGVEDAATMNCLADLGCDEAQGFHIGRPVPADDLPDWVLRAARRPRAPLLSC